MSATWVGEFLELLVWMERRVLQDSLVCLAYLDPKASLEQLASRESKEWMACQDSPEERDNQGHLVALDLKEDLDSRDLLDLRAREDYLALTVCRV
jgi:hypothetical protein